MGKDRAKQLQQYIKEDRPVKLKSYVKKHRIVLSDIELNKDRNLLHYCCKHGSGTTLGFLLHQGLDAMLPDKEGNSPLHIALYRAHKRKSCSSNVVYTDIVLPLIEKFPNLLARKNRLGVTPRTLLDHLVHQKLKEKGHRDRKSSSEDSDWSEEKLPSADSEWSDKLTSEANEWSDKLTSEAEQEYGANWGTYEEDFTGNFDDKETENDWRERIREDYNAKRSASFYATNPRRDKQGKSSGKSSKCHHKETSGPEILENVREHLRKQFERRQKQLKQDNVKQKKSKYEKQFTELINSDKTDALRYNDIPWPDAGDGKVDIVKVLFSELADDSDTHKKYLKEQQVRWHPDKFVQKLGSRLDEQDKDKILTRVNEISQALNKYSEISAKSSGIS